MTREDELVQSYLQAAHDRGGGWQMAMRMMAGHLLDERDAVAELRKAVSDLRRQAD